MNIEIIKSLEDAEKARRIAVVIDVFRAFTTEAYVFSNGAEKIIPVQSLEEAHRLKEVHPDYLVMGERRGVKPDGFDFGNSPTEMLGIDFTAKTVIHSTSNGTKGLINATNATTILVGSFVMASSIVRFIEAHDCQDISLISTSPDVENDNEDVLLAYYIRDTLLGKPINEQGIKETLLKTSAHAFLSSEANVPTTDFDLCLDFNRFNFVIKKEVENGQMYLKKFTIP